MASSSSPNASGALLTTPISGPCNAAQLALRQSFVFTDSLALLQPEVLIPKCAERFDAESNLTDQSTRELIAKQMHAFAAWIRVVRGASPEAVGPKG